MWQSLTHTLGRLFRRTDGPPPDLDRTLAELRQKTPAPVFWLLGKTQSGKSSVTRYLTGADEAVVGTGFRPCTATSRRFQFPTPDAPLLDFLDTRGVDEPGYDPAEDIRQFDPIAHAVIVTAKATDFAQGNVRAALGPIRRASPGRPVVLCVTCLNEATPRQPHPAPYPFACLTDAAVPIPESVPEPLRRCIDEHRRAFAGLFDVCVPIDLTRPEDGFPDPDYGGELLKAALLDLLPSAYRQTLLRLKEATDALKDAHLRHAVPVVLGYTSMAATAGAVPVPFLDLVLLPGIQAKMAHHLAGLYGQEMNGDRLTEIMTAVGAGLATRTVVRQALKFIPVVGSAAGAAVAGASTYGLGRAFCYYFQAVHDGHVPNAAALKSVYQEQFDAAQTRLRRT